MSTDLRIEELDNLIASTIEKVRLGPASLHLSAYASQIRRALGNAYFMVPRTELPETEIIDSYGTARVKVDGGSWPADRDPAPIRQRGLEYLAAAEAITAHRAAEKSAAAEDARRLDARRDAITQELTQTDGVTYASRTNIIRRAVDRIIELEDHQPKGI